MKNWINIEIFDGGMVNWSVELLRKSRDPWVAQLVEHPTFGLVSGHDLMAYGFEPQVGLLLADQSLLGTLSVSYSLFPSPTYALSLSFSL